MVAIGANAATRFVLKTQDSLFKVSFGCRETLKSIKVTIPRDSCDCYFLFIKKVLTWCEWLTPNFKCILPKKKTSSANHFLSTWVTYEPSAPQHSDGLLNWLSLPNCQHSFDSHPCWIKNPKYQSFKAKFEGQMKGQDDLMGLIFCTAFDVNDIFSLSINILSSLRRNDCHAFKWAPLPSSHLPSKFWFS